MEILRRFMKTAAVTGAAGVVAMIGIAVPAGWQAAPAEAAVTTVQLPIAKYSHMLIDPVHHHIFFTGGSGSTGILVTDYSGNTVATIPSEDGATGLALSDDGSTVYAALADGDAISAISTSTLTQTASYSTGTGTDPTYVAYTSGDIWFGYGAATQGGIGSVNLATGAVTLNATNDPINTWYAAPMLAATPGGKLVAGEPGQSPAQLASYDVSSGTATVLAAPEYLNGINGTTVASDLDSLAITPDGQDVVTATQTPYEQQVFQVSDLALVGDYPTGAYPNSVSIASDGTVAAGTYSANEVYVFAPGGSTPLNTYGFGSNWLAIDGVAITPDDGGLFAVTTADPYGDTPTLTIIPDPAQSASTLSLSGPATAKQRHPITLTGKLGGPGASVGGQTLTVTRVDPDGTSVTLPDVTTAADGSFTITDTPQGVTGAVTYHVTYAGDTYLSPATANASVTVQKGIS